MSAPFSASPSVNVGGDIKAFMFLCQILSAQLAEEETGKDKDLKANQLSVVQGQLVLRQ